MIETVEGQRQALDKPVDARFINQAPHVKGAYTTGDYVRWKLNQVFGPDNWSHMLMKGPDLVPVNERNAYVQVTVRLEVKFANGELVIHEDVGVWPLQATRGTDLDGTMPERYETVLKAAITDGIKACAEYLGTCFRPLGDGVLDRFIRGGTRENASKARTPQPEAASASAEGAANGLAGAEESEKIGPTQFWARFNDLVQEGHIQPDLRNAPEIKKARQSGDWAALIRWLETQT